MADIINFDEIRRRALEKKGLADILTEGEVADAGKTTDSNSVATVTHLTDYKEKLHSREVSDFCNGMGLQVYLRETMCAFEGLPAVLEKLHHDPDNIALLLKTASSYLVFTEAYHYFSTEIEKLSPFFQSPLFRFVEQFPEFLKKTALKIITLDPSTADGYYYLAEYYQQHDFIKAEQCYLRAIAFSTEIQRDNGNAELYYFQLFDLYTNIMNDNLKAEQLLLKGIEEMQSDGLIEKLADFYLANKKYDLAIAMIGKLDATGPDKLHVEYLLEKARKGLAE